MPIGHGVAVHLDAGPIHGEAKALCKPRKRGIDQGQNWGVREGATPHLETARWGPEAEANAVAMDVGSGRPGEIQAGQIMLQTLDQISGERGLTPHAALRPSEAF